MTMFVDGTVRFYKAAGGAVRVELWHSVKSDSIEPLMSYVMPRNVFMEALKEATAHIAMLQREDADAYIADLPTGRKAKG